MKKQSIQFLCVVLFFGILLSVTLYAGIGNLSGQDTEFEGIYGVNGILSSGESIRTFIRYIDYRVFRHVEDRGVVIGKDHWLYETEDSSCGFDYLLDYVSGTPFTDTEMARIGNLLERRVDEYAARGIEYRLVVIPSTYTAAGEFLPNYLGKPSERMRLSVLSEYLAKRGISSFMDLSEVMATDKTLGAKYHNTEDSINAYGGFFVYDSVMASLNGEAIEPYRLSFEEIEFATHYTDGKKIAQRIGLEEIIPNNTVSLTNQLNERYSMYDTTEHCVSSRMNDGFEGSDLRVLIECSREWDKIQLTPYFSASFSEVVYENRVTDGALSVETHRPDVLLQIIHEGELGSLLNQ